jgi:lipoprotein-anchoring transpeptidase ErfK/SrfK
MYTRRRTLVSLAALATPALVSPALAAPSEWDAWDAEVTPAGFDLGSSNPWGLHPRLLPRMVKANPGLRVGDIHVDAVARYLYHIQPDDMAMRYGVAIGRDGLYQPGVYTIRRKAKWPHWVPTPTMIAREPEKYARWADGGQPPGPANALGSRALYLYAGGRDTYLRIHGTPAPRSIGTRASSGCVRMVMPHINALYDQVETGVTVYLYPTDGRPL